MDPLAQLNDIQTPSGVDWWPLAWGWWAVIALALLIIVLTARACYRHRQFTKAKREALATLATFSAEPAQAAVNTNQLLKRVAKHYFGAEAVSALYGDKWLQFLQSTVSSKHAVSMAAGLEVMIGKVYQQSPCTDAEASDIFTAASIWLKQANLKQMPIETTTIEAQGANHV